MDNLERSDLVQSEANSTMDIEDQLPRRELTRLESVLQQFEDVRQFHRAPTQLLICLRNRMRRRVASMRGLKKHLETISGERLEQRESINNNLRSLREEIQQESKKRDELLELIGTDTTTFIKNQKLKQRITEMRELLRARIQSSTNSASPNESTRESHSVRESMSTTQFQSGSQSLSPGESQSPGVLPSESQSPGVLPSKSQSPSVLPSESQPASESSSSDSALPSRPFEEPRRTGNLWTVANWRKVEDEM